MANCWQERGCDEEMAGRCPHATSSIDGVCVAECFFTRCDRPQHKMAVAPELYFSVDVDRTAAIKQTCTFCEFFLQHGPRAVQHEADVCEVMSHNAPHADTLGC